MKELWRVADGWAVESAEWDGDSWVVEAGHKDLGRVTIEAKDPAPILEHLPVGDDQ